MNNIFKKIDDWRWEIPKGFKPEMRTSALVYADEKMLADIIHDNAYQQLVNVACLPGIVGKALAMPDIHFGYGFPIGGVAAFDPENGGVISPGGVGYDINCGVRVLRTNLTHADIKDRIKDIVYRLASDVPSGVGSEGDIRLSSSEIDKVLINGSKWAVSCGYGEADDIKNTEANGCLEGADPNKVSKHAKERGFEQSGTLGSGNHFLEVQVVEEIYDPKTADQFGLFKDQVTIMLHSGSRGLGHQVCTDYISVMLKAAQKYGINLPDRQLCCAPINSPEGKEYFAAMAAAANFAWANRQVLMHLARESFSKILGASSQLLGMSLIYDVAHNIAKMERYKILNPKPACRTGRSEILNNEKLLCVHRKGATRAFPGQPVLIPGDMGRYSYILVGTEKAMKESFGSVCHGAGRRLSRTAASKQYSADKLVSDLEHKGIIVKGASRKGLVEEAPEAYKDVADVVNIVHHAGLARKVARMRPVGVIKG
jgi:tRNA-splicing ligase RtcB